MDEQANHGDGGELRKLEEHENQDDRPQLLALIEAVTCLLYTSVASGPAFEGAGISCGMPGITGAVSHVSYDRGFLCDIVGGGEAKGCLLYTSRCV